MEHTVSESEFLKVSPVGSTPDEDEVPRFTLEPMANVVLLPDDVLLCIMKYLGPIELVNFGKVTERFAQLIEDKNLWKKVDFQPHKIKEEELLKYVHYFKRTTKSIALRGFVSEYPDVQWREQILTPNLMKSIAQNCPELETLILDEHFASAPKLGLELFPLTLLHLSMKGCFVSDLSPRRSYFQRMNDFLPFLKVLDLSNCTWVSPHDFMSISKCRNLEELRMDSCPQLGDCVAYTSLAARFGFHSLKILDLRNTRMGDSDVGCFNWSRNLTHLYLQCPPSRYVCKGMCGNPLCLEPDRDDYFSSSDDDFNGEFDDCCDLEDYVSIPGDHGGEDHHIWLSSPTHLENSQPSPSMNSEKTLAHSNEARSDSYNASASTSSASLVRDENSNSNFPKASTSQAAGHSADLTAKDQNSLQEQISEDSYSSSEESNITCPSSSHSKFNSHKHKIIENTAAQSNQISSPVSENGNRGTKRRHSSGNCSEDTENLGTSNSTIPTSMSAGSCQNESRNLRQESDDVHVRKLQRVPDYSSDGEEGTTFRRQGFQFNELEFPRRHSFFFRSTQRRRSRTNIRTSPFKRSNNDKRNVPLCKFSVPRLYRLPPAEPYSESMISDLCIMSFVLNDGETDGAGYVRIISPHLASARPQLHTLVVKDFRMITDASLLYLVKLNSLRYLDVSGTSVTEVGVLQFKLKRPDVEVVSDHDRLPI